jgi:DNA-binding response OmpR family regulator
MTALTDKVDKVKGLNLGAVDYLNVGRRLPL